MKKSDVTIIGGGPAGMCAAVAAAKSGADVVTLIERDDCLGGILKQCIHNGFGIQRFGLELTGPEYSSKCEEFVNKYNIHVLKKTMVISLSPDKIITAVNKSDGIFNLKNKAVILAMGCRERPRGALNIPGSRPSGIFTAGTAQKFVNVMGYLPGKKIVILGSGDIGLIMARRMTLEGSHVCCVCELMHYSSGLARNLQQCLIDFDIPLLLSHTVIKIHGSERITGVTIAQVDSDFKPINGTEEYIDCDTLLLSCGLIPENELAAECGIPVDIRTNGVIVDQDRCSKIEGIFACGNVLHVHDIADYASNEGDIAGQKAADYVNGKIIHDININLICDGKIRYTVPQIINCIADTKVYYRVSDVYKNVEIKIYDGINIVKSIKKDKVAPGEMQTVIINKKILSELKSDTLEFRLEEVTDGN